MRLDIGSLLLLSGLAVAAPFGENGRSHIAVRQAAVRRPLLVSAKPRVVAAPSVKFDTKRVIDKALSVDPAQVVGAVRGVVDSFDWPRAIEGVKSAFLEVDVADVLKKYVIPVGIYALQELQQFSGEHVLDQVSKVKGKEVLDMVRKFDTGLIWEAYEDFNVDGFLKVVPGLDTYVSPLVQKLREIDGAEFLDGVQNFNGQQLGELLVDVLDLTHVSVLLDMFGVDLRPLLEKLMPVSGAEALKLVEAFDGAQFLQFLASLDGDKIAELTNSWTNYVLSEARSVVSAMTGGSPPAPYNSFDLFKSIDVVQEFVESLVGLKFPSGTAEIKAFTGANAMEHFKKVDLDTLVQIATAGLKLAHIGAVESLKYINQKRAQNPTLTKLGHPLLQGILQDIKDFNGEKFLELVRTLNMKAIVQTIRDIGTLDIVKAFTGVDFTRYMDVLENFDGATLLKNVENLTGDRIGQLLDDLNATEYLEGFTGIDFAPVLMMATSIDGATYLDLIKTLNGEAVLELVTSLTGVNLTPAASKPGPAASRPAKRPTVKIARS